MPSLLQRLMIAALCVLLMPVVSCRPSTTVNLEAQLVEVVSGGAPASEKRVTAEVPSGNGSSVRILLNVDSNTRVTLDDRTTSLSRLSGDLPMGLASVEVRVEAGESYARHVKYLPDRTSENAGSFPMFLDRIQRDIRFDRKDATEITSGRIEAFSIDETPQGKYSYIELSRPIRYQGLQAESVTELIVDSETTVTYKRGRRAKALEQLAKLHGRPASVDYWLWDGIPIASRIQVAK